MQLVSSLAVVRDQQEPDADLGDENRLAERQEMSHDAPGSGGPEVRKTAPGRREQRDSEHDIRNRVVDG